MAKILISDVEIDVSDVAAIHGSESSRDWAMISLVSGTRIIVEQTPDEVGRIVDEALEDIK